MSPPLPEETQASLLSVGMRVRKSVPEGYKTHKTMDVPSSSAPRSLHAPRTRPPLRSGQSRELTPFCGLHKTGGLAMQELPPSSAPAAMQTYVDNDEEDHDEDVMPGLSMSQTTIPSNQSSFSYETHLEHNAKKRTYDEELEDDLDVLFDDMDGEDTVIEPHPRAIRPLAKLKQSAKHGLTVPGNVHPGGMIIPDGCDFEEAAFLTPRIVDR